jgi:LPS export ABC transporter protein LptC
MNQQKSGFNTSPYIKKIRIAVLLAGAAIFFCACENKLEEIKAFSSSENLPVLEAYDFETHFTDSGQMRFTLKTPKLLRYENDGEAYVEFPEGMELVEYDAQNRIISSLKSDYAKQFVKDQKWEAKNNVVATNQAGDTLKTDQLIWDEKNEKIYSDVFVEIIREDQIMTGIGFTSDQDLNNWKIKDPKGSIFVEVNEEGKPIPENQPETENSRAIEPQQRQPLQFEN